MVDVQTIRAQYKRNVDSCPSDGAMVRWKLLAAVSTEFQEFANRSLAILPLHPLGKLPIVSGMQSPKTHGDLPVCAKCGEPITDRQDIDYTLDTDGNLTSTFHTDTYHREMVYGVWKCSGNTAGGHVDCDFTTDSEDEATRHYETLDHDVAYDEDAHARRNRAIFDATSERQIELDAWLDGAQVCETCHLELLRLMPAQRIFQPWHTTGKCATCGAQL